jgi:DNA-binding CsgD family transcriptional regulator
MRYPLSLTEDFKIFCQQIEFDLNLKDYKDTLIDWKKLDKLIVMRNQFFYVNDFTNATNIYVHPNVEIITGYPPEEFLDFGRIYDFIHPVDREFVYEFSKRTIFFARNYREELISDPQQSLFSIDFRICHKSGHYVKVNRQATCLKTDKKGNMVFALLLFTDVSHLRKDDTYNIFWLGDTRNLFYFKDLIKKYGKDYKISDREKDVLKLLAKGYSSRIIAKKLFISIHTVISHRKNLLHKTGTKNTVELVRFAFEKALLE